ncbi:MFS general substrate transporter [Serendipita vermifera]|nr:MFS general substrate transporter [Serendipita vermifera]
MSASAQANEPNSKEPSLGPGSTRSITQKTHEWVSPTITESKNLHEGNSAIDGDALGDLDAFPDGGWQAWSVVFGVACTTFSTFGYVNAWGVFQAFYENVKFPNESPSLIAWVGSMQYSLVWVPGLLIGRLFDRGYFRLPFMTANAVLILATFLIAECNAFWQVMLCQGVLIGFASGVMFSPLLTILSHWFKKKRGLVFGCSAVGSSIGGTIVPILVRELLPRVGFRWTMRILGFMFLGLLSISNLLMKRRLPPCRVKGQLVDLSHFRNLAFCIYTASSVVSFLGLYTVLTYIAAYAIQYDISENTAFYLVSIINAASLFGRLFSGLLADKYGPLNMMAPSTLFAGILTYAWPWATTLRSLIPLCVLYGFSSGAFVALIGSSVAPMGDIESLGERMGLLFTLTATGAIAGPPISGAVRTSSNGWMMVGAYAGTMIILSSILLWTTKVLLVKHIYRGIA